MGGNRVQIGSHPSGQRRVGMSHRNWSPKHRGSGGSVLAEAVTVSNNPTHSYGSLISSVFQSCSSSGRKRDGRWWRCAKL